MSMRLRKRSVAGVLLLTLFAGSLDSKGAQEQTLSEGEIRIYLVQDGTESEVFAERLLLPSSLSLYVWNEFQIGDSEVSLEARGGYRVISKRLVRAEKWDGRSVYGYQLKLNYYSSVAGPSGTLYPVSFEYDSSSLREKETISQPAGRAILQAIRASGKESGLARVKELTYLGRERFEAQVEIR